MTHIQSLRSFISRVEHDTMPSKWSLLQLLHRNNDVADGGRIHGQAAASFIHPQT